jgi:hypothetical protein
MRRFPHLPPEDAAKTGNADTVHFGDAAMQIPVGQC